MVEPRSRAADEAVDPDVDLHVPAQRAETRQGLASIVTVVAVGGAIGASGRYGAALLWPTAGGAFPWTTLIVNVAGCAVIGAFMVLITEKLTPHRLVRPFFGTGVLGGFTTFSTYTTDIRRLADAGHAETAVAYLALTAVAAVLAVWASAAATRRVVLRGRR